MSTKSAVPGTRDVAAAGNDPWLEWMRGVAALLVFVAHLRGLYFVAWADLDAASRNPVNAVLFELSRLGREAVVVFFVLSGFLVGGRALRDFAASRFSLPHYAADRVSRLHVVLLPALCVTAACDAARGEWASGSLNPGVFLSNLLFLQDVTAPVFGSNGPLWSLAYEAWYYVVFGLGLDAAREFRDGRTARAAVTGALATAVLIWLGSHNPRLVAMFPLWIGGAALAALTEEKSRTSRYRWIPWIVLPIALVGSSFTGDVAGNLIVGVATLLAIGCRGLPGDMAAAAARAGSAIASASFSLYAIHYPIVALAIAVAVPKRIGHAGIMEWGLLVALALPILLLATVFQRLFERRTPVVRRRLYRVIDRMRRSSPVDVEPIRQQD